MISANSINLNKIIISKFLYICFVIVPAILQIRISRPESNFCLLTKEIFRSLCRFLRNSQELKNIKNISSLRHQMRIKLEPEEEAAFSASPEAKLEQESEADMPTDLSMSSMNQPMSEQQQQPLSLHDPPAKYRSHTYNLVKTNQEPEERK